MSRYIVPRPVTATTSASAVSAPGIAAALVVTGICTLTPLRKAGVWAASAAAISANAEANHSTHWKASLSV